MSGAERYQDYFTGSREGDVRVALKPHSLRGSTQMLRKTILCQCFVKNQQTGLQRKSPVPPNVEKHIGAYITRPRVYLDSVCYQDGDMQMKGSVRSYTDATVIRKMFISSNEHTYRSVVFTQRTAVVIHVCTASLYFTTR